MRNIQPLQIWKDGVVKTAEVLDARIVNDNLLNTCTFYWELKTENTESIMNGERLAEGNHTIKDTEYTNWDGSNESSYAIIAASINVTLI